MRSVFAQASVIAFAAALTAPAGADESVQYKSQFTLTSGLTGTCPTIVTVPPGKRLIVEFVSARMTPWGQSGKAYAAELWTTLAGVSAHHVLDLQPVQGTSRHSLSQSLRLPSDTGIVKFCALRVSGLDTMDVNVTLAGTLVDVP